MIYQGGVEEIDLNLEYGEVDRRQRNMAANRSTGYSVSCVLKCTSFTKILFGFWYLVSGSVVGASVGVTVLILQASSV